MKKSELPEKATQNTDGTWVCKACGSDIMAATVAHSIWLKEFTCAGTGKVKYEEVPYCPKCEEKPSFHGSPIRRSIGEDIADDLF